jgi:hypothetical protein
MQKPRPLSELLQIDGKKLRELKSRLEQRESVLAQVRSRLPPKLAAQVLSAGIDRGRLTIGVNGAAWASRLRYCTAALRKDVGAALAVELVGVRIRVLPPPEAGQQA